MYNSCIKPFRGYSFREATGLYVVRIKYGGKLYLYGTYRDEEHAKAVVEYVLANRESGMPLGEEVFSWYEAEFGAANLSTRIFVTPTDEGYLSPTGLLKPIPCFAPYVIGRNGECFYLYSMCNSLYVRPVKRLLSRGYWKVGLSHSTGPTQQFVHRLVAMAWLPDYTDNLIVDHIDRDKTNNDYSNLRMVTHVMNAFNTSKRKHFFNSDIGMWEVKFTLAGEKRDFGAYKNEAEALTKLKEIEAALCARKKI